jgi:glycosyltransferase involved in cell wall biosynthesis
VPDASVGLEPIHGARPRRAPRAHTGEGANGTAPIRVLHCIPSVWPGSGGPTRAVVEMTRAVHATCPSIVVDVASSDHQLTSAWRDHLVERLPESSSLHIFPESKWLDKGASARMARWLRRVVRDYDVVHIHALFNSLSSSSAWISKWAGVPYIIRPLGTLSPYTFRNRRRLMKRAYFRVLDKPAIENAFAIHFTAPQEAEKASRLKLDVHGTVIPIPFRGEQATPDRRANAPEVLFLARLHPVKGLDLLLPAFARVQAVLPAAQLVIAGTGTPSYENWLRAEASALGISDNVRFTGFVDGETKRNLLKRAAVMCLPSYQENFGVAVVEGLGAGLPVVITKSVDLWPSVQKFRSGIVTESSVEQLADAILQLLTDERMRAEMGGNGIRQVKELYSYAAVGRQLCSLYTDAANVHRER